MLIPAFTTRFNKDIKKLKKSGKDFDKIKDVIKQLINEETLAPKYKDHVLIGNHKDRRECHIEPDWLMIYKIDGSTIIFERSGNHNELFK